jgi:hypothetical protein
MQLPTVERTYPAHNDHNGKKRRDRNEGCNFIPRSSPHSRITHAAYHRWANHAAHLAQADALVGMLRDGGLVRGLRDAEVGEAARHLDQVVARVEYVERISCQSMRYETGHRAGSE